MLDLILFHIPQHALHSTQMEVGDEISKRNEESVTREQRGGPPPPLQARRKIHSSIQMQRERETRGGDLGGAAQSLIINKGRKGQGRKKGVECNCS